MRHDSPDTVLATEASDVRHREPFVLTVIKAARNTAADALAELLCRLPPLEPAYRTIAAMGREIPGVRTLLRETTDRLIRRLVNVGRQFRPVLIGPVTAQLDVSHFTVAGRYFAGVPYEPGTTAVLCSALGPGGVFVDIGANTGYFTIIAGLLVGSSGRVVAFEPNAAVRARLERHVARNGLSERIVVSDVAVGDRERESADFYLSCSAANDGLSSLTRSAIAFREGGLRPDVTASVRVRTFDALAEQLGLREIDPMKVDVEGAEYEVFAGMSRTLSTCRPRQIICETPRGSDTERLLTGYGYRVRVADEVKGGTPNLLFVLDEAGEK